ncbi:MAG: hypothetical protein HYU51_10735 [Candidatus Rokubacteria bacterium]|nr:hypothetical protein [Candidatus Rokubacteria bacterium]
MTARVLSRLGHDRIVAALATVSWLLVMMVEPAAAGMDRIAAALHVHSDLTTGAFSLDELAEMAPREGVEAIFLAENYLLRVEYGLPPFRALMRVVRETRSVSDLGIARYLVRVAETGRRHPRVVFVPGVEVVPHYRWSGAPWSLAMTLHDTQKNILVYGLRDATALARLPSIGNPRVGRFSVQSMLDALPVTLLAPAVWAVSTKRQRRVRIGRAFVLVRQRRWLLGATLAVVAVVALVRGWPFLTDRYPYWTDAGLSPQQELIDEVSSLGGVTIWSLPEARDHGERFVGPVRVAWRTEPYADDLLRTGRYTAFGAVYEDTTRFEQPGEGWDRVLGEYVRGERSRPAWAVGESAFHSFTAGKRLAGVQTVFLTRDRSEAGLLQALRDGAMYALQRTPDATLLLDEFAIAAGRRVAGSGRTLQAAAGTPIEIRLAIGVTSGSMPVRVSLIRNGRIVDAWSGTAPFQVVHRETFDGGPAFYRIDVHGAARPHRLLTNPIFVRP